MRASPRRARSGFPSSTIDRTSGAREDGEIMGDAGAIICQRDPTTYTGKIFYDEDVLTEAGITDFSRYAVISD